MKDQREKAQILEEKKSNRRKAQTGRRAQGSYGGTRQLCLGFTFGKERSVKIQRHEGIKITFLAKNYKTKKAILLQITQP